MTITVMKTEITILQKQQRYLSATALKTRLFLVFQGMNSIYSSMGMRMKR